MAEFESKNDTLFETSPPEQPPTMKHIAFFATIGFLTLSFSTQALRLSEPVQANARSETFGAPITELPEAVTITELLETPEKFSKKKFSMQAQVSKVCQKKGCFFIAQQENHFIRVAFKDYAFFVPTTISGEKVTLVGELLARNISEEQAEHFNKDLSGSNTKDGHVKSGRVYEILATSVRVPIQG